jgi:hypothetical protein
LGFFLFWGSLALGGIEFFSTHSAIRIQDFLGPAGANYFHRELQASRCFEGLSTFKTQPAKDKPQSSISETKAGLTALPSRQAQRDDSI